VDEWTTYTVEALYLPHVPNTRREVAADRLAGLAGPGREVPVSLHRIVAIRSSALPA